jgi:predicted permease
MSGLFLFFQEMFVLYGIAVIGYAILIFVAVLITGMPSAPTNSLYAQKYGGDACFASMGVCLTILFSILSLPALYGLLQLLLAI